MPISSAYNTKPLDYYSPLRAEIAGLLPRKVNRSLEVGCGTGATSAWIKSACPAEYVAGIELFEEAALVARQVLDEVFLGDVERMEIPIAERSLDLILCLDVLEHLVDPWGAVKRLSRLLANGGVFVASIPNVQHYRVSLPLLRGCWTYTEEGLLDKTHLRFFVKSSIRSLFEDAGLSVDTMVSKMGNPGTRRAAVGRALDRITLGTLNGVLTFQYLVRASSRT